MFWAHYYVTYGTQCDILSGEDVFESCMVIVKTPKPVAALEWLADRICVVTGHRFCNALPMKFVRALALNHSEEFPIAVPDEVILRYAHWRGWEDPFWLGIDVDDEETIED